MNVEDTHGNICVPCILNFSFALIHPASSHKRGAGLESMQHYTDGPVLANVFFKTLT